MLYPSAKAIVYDPTNPSELLMLRRKGYYEPAGGKLRVSFAKKEAETLEQCAVRECEEELGAKVNIIQYLGSYHFFWTRLPDAMSVCALYAAELISVDISIIKDEDYGGFPTEPVWVNIHDILNNNAPIDPYFVGLEPLIKKFAELQLTIRSS
jgi:8-oxo-dGTP pyrophosphatase MutT (NUDIX family)